jgi:nitroreductase
MDVLEAIKTRRSIRKYKKAPVPEEELEKILDAGRWAPSASNLQPWKFIVLSDFQVRERVARLLTFGNFLAEAPLGIAVVVDPMVSNHPVEDGSIAAYSMLLAAHAVGLGGCWLNPSHNEEELKEIFGIPKEVRLISVISLGYPDEAPSMTRRELRDVTFTNRYGSK